MKKLFLFFLLFILLRLASCVEKQVYVVHLGGHKGDKALHEIEEHHHSYLLSVKATEEEARASLLYSYKHSINGFAALLTPDEASRLNDMEEVLSVFRSHARKYSLHTTRSWEFVGLEEEERGEYKTEAFKGVLDDRFKIGRALLRKAKYGGGVIVGVLDSGVWPESRSYSYHGMGPVPKSWKGVCQTGPGFNASHCNRKIIGARYYVKAYEHEFGPLNATLDFRSPRDADGHGTHTSSTVAGRRVPGAAALGGFAFGTASGGAPLAHLAIYKACWAVPHREKVDGNTCFEVDMLAAIDDAIADGVHILSISIGTKDPVPFQNDGIAMGALAAVRKNIVVACSAGNSGPAPRTLSNVAPWIITVGASSLDRSFVGPVNLGNGKKIDGQTVTPHRMDRVRPLVYAEDVVAPGVPSNVSSQCLSNTLSPQLVKDKVVLCMRGVGMRVSKGLEVKRAGGAGMILGNSPANGDELVVDPHFLPATAVTASDAERILEYIKSTNKPKAIIQPARTVLRYQAAPYMAAFSSRGPSVLDPNILKPDITAPGLNILAAWSGALAPTKLSEDNRRAAFNIMSGTSMSSPHIAAAAALLRAIHPEWSSAAIRSALMTTAWMTNDEKKPIADASGHPADPFMFGSGHFRPTKAADPGLVYDATFEDYLLYLCSLGVRGLDPTFKCPDQPPSPANLNYPSLAFPNLNGTVTVRRTVKNVGGSKKDPVYFFSARPPLGFSVEASPSVLPFKKVGEEQSFTITVKPRSDILSEITRQVYYFGWYTWTDGYHYVRSPMAVSLA